MTTPAYRTDVKAIIDEPRPWPTQTTQFRVGHVNVSATFWAMFGEREFQEPQTEKEEWAQDDMPVSLFADIQGEIFIDHDFMRQIKNPKDNDTNGVPMAYIGEVTYRIT